ncbi:hypothetical protein FRB98_003669 [Tulasnella sp. 332]|nr:hypothetical protein FRB98_003669 [Tulasnella sp. 332]
MRLAGTLALLAIFGVASIWAAPVLELAALHKRDGCAEDWNGDCTAAVAETAGAAVAATVGASVATYGAMKVASKILDYDMRHQTEAADQTDTVDQTPAEPHTKALPIAHEQGLTLTDINDSGDSEQRWNALKWLAGAMHKNGVPEDEQRRKIAEHGGDWDNLLATMTEAEKAGIRV